MACCSVVSIITNLRQVLPPEAVAVAAKILQSCPRRVHISGINSFSFLSWLIEGEFPMQCCRIFSILILTLISGTGVAAETYTAPRTEWGAPDLQGVLSLIHI